MTDIEYIKSLEKVAHHYLDCVGYHNELCDGLQDTLSRNEFADLKKRLDSPLDLNECLTVRDMEKRLLELVNKDFHSKNNCIGEPLFWTVDITKLGLNWMDGGPIDKVTHIANEGEGYLEVLMEDDKDRREFVRFDTFPSDIQRYLYKVIMESDILSSVENKDNDL